MGVIEFIIALLILFTFLTGWILAIYHIIHVLKRRYRIEREADERQHKKQMAEDWAAVRKELSDGATLGFDEYYSTTQRQQIKK